MTKKQLLAGGMGILCSLPIHAFFINIGIKYQVTALIIFWSIMLGSGLTLILILFSKVLKKQ